MGIVQEKRIRKLLEEYDRMNFKREYDLYNLYTRWGLVYSQDIKVNSQIVQGRDKHQLQVQISYGTFGAGLEICLSVDVNLERKELKYSMPNISYVAQTHGGTIEMENIRNAYILSGKLLEHQEIVLKEMTKVLQKYMREQSRIETELGSLRKMYPMLFE